MTNIIERLTEVPRTMGRRRTKALPAVPGTQRPSRPSLRSKWAALPVALVLLCGLLLVSEIAAPDTKTVTVSFPQAVSVYEGSDVVIMGVKVGRVASLKAKGDHVDAVIEYQSEYKLPKDVKAAIVTPTLVADRFVQLTPAYTSGPAMADGGKIPVSRTATPVELDRIYGSLSELTTALGPNGANKNGALSDVLSEGADALEGNGKVGNKAISDMSEAAQVLGGNSEQLFETLSQLSEVTTTLAKNDKTTDKFLTDLGTVSSQLAGESDELDQALVAIAQAVHVTRDFVKNNQDALVGDVKELNTTLGVLAKEKKTIGEVVDLAPLGIGNLAEAFDTRSGSVGFRLQVGPIGNDLSNILCMVVENDKIPGSKEICALFKALLPTGSTDSAGQALTDQANAPTRRETESGLPVETPGGAQAKQPEVKPEVVTDGGISELSGSLQDQMSGGKR
ncbi:virulence factor Mce-like protein [Nocardioides albertanoniae]|uniref:Virulence factor Mce-like protein n=1 Tax=Nocardioides albertanoniae TaxID=1175486 RepID=A0A543A7E4_9ACTN|nr:MCE family protein [Nocardioides albertanoniae]TQL68440.1 virulence factor Mce-like protein [Nocardioides albertanoniae]